MSVQASAAPRTGVAARRSVRLARACRAAHVQLLLDAFNAWAMNPTATTRQRLSHATQRYARQLEGGTFPVPDTAPFAPASRGQRYGLPEHLPALLKEAGEVLPKLREAEEREKTQRSADARERGRRTQQAKRDEAKASRGPAGGYSLPPWE